MLRENETHIYRNKKEMQYKNLPKEFNLVSLKARYNLNEINVYLKEKKEREEQRRRELEEQRMFNLKQFTKPPIEKKKPKKLLSLSPSDEAQKKIRNYKFWEAYDIAQKLGLNNHLRKLVPISINVRKIRKKLEERIPVVNAIKLKQNNSNDNNNQDSNLIIIQENENKIENIKNLNENLKGDFTTISINENEKTKNEEFDIFGISKQNNSHERNSLRMQSNSLNSIISDGNASVNKLKYNKSSSDNVCIENRNKKIIKSNSFIDNSNKKLRHSLDENKFFLNRHLNPISCDKAIRVTYQGGGVLHCNSIWRGRSVGDMVPYYSPKKMVQKIKELKAKRNELLYQKDYRNYLAENTFISNINYFNNNDFFLY